MAFVVYVCMKNSSWFLSKQLQFEKSNVVGLVEFLNFQKLDKNIYTTEQQMGLQIVAVLQDLIHLYRRCN